ncbi:MAG: hypothetical protein ACOCP8_02315, partial [archaeon]
FKKAFPRIIGRNVKMLYDFVELCRNSDIRPGGVHYQKIKGTNRGLGQSLKKTINKWFIENLNDYNTTRFTNKLEDVARLTRPKDRPDTKKYFKYIFKPRSGSRRLTFGRAKYLQETIDILMDENRTNEQFNIALDNIKNNRLQMDEIKFTFGKLNDQEKKEVFMYFVPGLRYVALTRNLVAIERAFATNIRRVTKTDPSNSSKTYSQLEVLSTNIPQELIDIVTKKLSNFDDYKASRMLFFGLLTAHEMIITTEWKKAINEVLKKAGNVAFRDLPDGRKIMCSADTSGSMSTNVTNSLKAVDIASYLTAALSQSIPGTKAYATASWTKTVPLDSDNLIDNAVKIANTNVAHGTNFETLLDHYNGEEVVILVTDGESTGNMEQKWVNLNKPKNAKLIVWHVAGWNYYHKISKRSDVIYLKGYNDNLLRILSNIITGKAGQPEIVRNMKL